ICLQTSREIEVNERLIADRRIEIEQHFRDGDSDNDGGGGGGGDADDDDDGEGVIAEDCPHVQRHGSRNPVTSSISLPPSPSSSQSSLSSPLSPSSSSSSSKSSVSSGTTETAGTRPTTANTSNANIIASRQQLRQQQHCSER
ncbi:unnamed protein product, partial [Litomosoides sigmodontis]